MIPEAVKHDDTKDIDGLVSNQGRRGSLRAQQHQGNSPSSPTRKIHVGHRASQFRPQHSAHQRYCCIALLGATAAGGQEWKEEGWGGWVASRLGN